APHRIVALHQRAAPAAHVGGQRARQLGGGGGQQLARHALVSRGMHGLIVGHLRQLHRRRPRRRSLVGRALLGIGEVQARQRGGGAEGRVGPAVGGEERDQPVQRLRRGRRHVQQRPVRRDRFLG